MRGSVVKLGDHINTDFVISGKYKFKSADLNELSGHIFEDLDPSLAERITERTILVAGRNFGCGSSREHAARLIKMKGVRAIVAKSFSRIFFRNAINIGLVAITASNEFVDRTEEGDDLEIDMQEGRVANHTKGMKDVFKPFPEFVSKILAEGGIVNYLKKHGGFPWDTR